jgi:16S rRNA (guanine1207-N2)-methyltransferase
MSPTRCYRNMLLSHLRNGVRYRPNLTGLFLALRAKARQRKGMTRPLIYGQIPLGLVDVPDDGLQVDPFFPAQASLETLQPRTYTGLVMRAPHNTLERQHDLALALRSLVPNSPFCILAPKEKGGSRLAKELNAFGVVCADTPKRHHRICTGVVPSDLLGLDEAIARGAMVKVPATGFYGQPGLFSWDRLDVGTALLLAHLPMLKGRGADFGVGTGQLSAAVLKSAKVTSLTGLDADRRALTAAHLNITDARFSSVWTDLRAQGSGLTGLDFVVTNPPFHEAGHEDQSLGQAFIQVAAQSLRSGGSLWLTANRHLPYEAILSALFKTVTVKAQANGFKVFEAVK